MPVLGDDKTMKKLGYKKVKTNGKITYVKDLTSKKINKNNKGAFVAGAIGAGLGMGAGSKFKSKVQPPKGEVVKGNTDSLTGKIVPPEKSVKEKKAIKRQAIEKMEQSLIGASKDFKKQQKQKPKKAKTLGPGVLTEREQKKALEALVSPSIRKKTGGITDKELKLLKSKKTGGMNLSPKADLDGDGKFSEYEKTRGSAIQKAMNEKPKQAFLGAFTNVMDNPVIKQGFSRMKKEADRKEKEEKMYLEQKARYKKPIQANEGTFVRGTGIAIKGTKFKGVF